MKPVLPIFALCLLLGCGGTSNEPGAMFFSENDQAMNAAIEKARLTFNYFVDHWQDKGVNYSLKIAVPLMVAW